VACAVLTGALAICCLVTLPLCHPVTTARAAPDEELPPVRRVLLMPDQLATELRRVQRGVLRQLPRGEFEELLAQAVAAGLAQRDPPRLVETRYRAGLAGQALVGSAQWTVRHAGPRPALLSVEPLQLALRAARWADDRPALLGDLDGRPQSPGLELLVDRPGDQSLTLGWSARGMPEPGGVRFDLRVPPCPVATLELELPADREPFVPREDGLLSGPLPAAAADRRTWRLTFGNTSQIDLSIRQSATGQPAPLVLARQRNRQDLAPGQTVCEFVLDLEVPFGSTRDLLIDCDPGLRPAEVLVRNLERWEVLPAQAAGAPTRVGVRLREPLLGGSLTLRAVAPAAAGDPWASPGVQVVGSVPRGEALTLRVHPDLHLDDWRAGPFRLVESSVAADRWQVLSLQSGLIRPGPGRPTARLRPAGPEYQVRERLWWQADAARMTLTARLTFDVSRGPVFQVPLRLPGGWDVERVETDPADMLASWSVPTADPSTLLVDLQRPLIPGSAPNLSVQLLQRRPTHGAAEWTAPLPDVLPLAARARDGLLAVRVAPALRSDPVGAPEPASRPPDERAAAPWSDAPADYVFALHGPAVEGSLRFWPRSARYRAAAASTVTVTGHRAVIVSRLRLESEPSGVDSVLLHSSAAGGPSDWRAVQGANRVRSVQPLELAPSRPLAVLAAPSPWHALMAAALPTGANGCWWRVTLTRPLSEPVEIEATTELPVPLGPDDAPAAVLVPLAASAPLSGLTLAASARAVSGRSWSVPLLTVPGADEEDHQVTLDWRAAPSWRVAPSGLSEIPEQDGGPRRRTYRYGSTPAALTLEPGGDTDTDVAVLDRARLITYATDARWYIHRLSLRLWDGARQRVPLELPPGSGVRLARVNGVAVRAETVSSGVGTHLELPVPAGVQVLTVEVIYTTPRPTGGVLDRIDAASPRLPAGAGGLRRVWCLRSDTVPLDSQRWLRLPSDTADGLAGANTTPLVPAAASGSARWGDTIARWAAEAGGGETPVLDLWALDEAGITPATPVPTGGRFWEAAGLVPVAVGGAVLLAGRESAGGLPRDWEVAVVQAARAGFDASGRFRRALDWACDGGTEVGGVGLLPADLRSRGTYWEPIDPSVAESGFWVVRPRDASLVGAVVALTALALVWAGRTWPARIQWAGLFAWLGLAAVAAVWLPPPLHPAARWPLLAALLAAGWKLIPGRPRPPVVPSSQARRPATLSRALTAGVLLAVWLGAPGRAAAPAPATVYLVPGPPDAPEPQTVLAPPDLLDQLRALARQGATGGAPAEWVAGAVPVGASYEGRVAGGQAQLKALIQIYSFTDDQTTLALPLAGVQLREALLDATLAFPRAAGDRILIPVRGRGPHTLELAFSAPCPGPGEDRELRFTIPELPMSRLTLRAPPRAAYLQALAWRGAQRVTEEPDGRLLEADLGRVGSVHVRWRLEGGEAPRPVVRTREAYLWDLTESAARLLGAIQFTVAPNSITSLTIDLPDDLEVAAVAARPLDPPAAGTAGWLREWRVAPANGGRQLLLEFATPITGHWQASLELVPRGPFAPSFALAFPAAQGAPAAPAVYAWRAQRVELEERGQRGVKPLAPEAFLKDHWLMAKAEADPRPPAAAYQRTVPGPAPQLRLRVKPGARDQALVEIGWQIQPRRAGVEASARVKVAGGRVSLVEWEVPAAVAVADVHGSEVHTWSRTGSRLQVWLRQPVAEAVVQWSGAVPRPADTGRFEVPAVRPLVATLSGTLRVAAREGWSLTPAQALRLEEHRPTGAGGREWVYSFAQPSYRAVFRVRPAAGATDFHLRTAAAVHDRRLVSTTTVEAQVRRGELRSLTIAARHGAGWEFQLDAPGAARVRESAAGAEVRSWVVDLPLGLTASYRLTLTARRPLDAAAEADLPDVGLDFGDQRPGQVVRTVALDGPGLRPREAVGLRPAWAAGGWEVIADDWRLRVRASTPRSPRGAPVRVELVDAGAALTDDGRWARRATVWLAHDAPAEIRATWPAPVHVLAVELDGRWLTPPHRDATDVRVPLPSAGSVRSLQLFWVPAEDDGPPARPDIPVLTADGDPVPAGPVLWTVHVPTGRAPDAAPAPLPDAASALHRAATQLRLVDVARTLRSAAADATRVARVRAAYYLRQAEAGLPDVGEDALGPEGQSLTTWRQQLRDTLRAGNALPLPTADPNEPPPFADAFARGQPAAWFVPAGDDGPRLAWQTPAPAWPGRLLWSAVLALLAVAGAWWSRRLGAAGWPELLMLLGLVAWVADGGAAWLVPAAAGVVARLALLGYEILRHWRPVPKVERVGG
jgi:hypothetical protein